MVKHIGRGVYDELKHTLDIVNIGDSGAVLIGEESKVIVPKDTAEILIATIRRDVDELQVDVCPMQVDVEWERCAGVECFVVISDGVAKTDLNLLLQELKENLTKECVEEVRYHLLMRGDLSYDDQAVIIGRLML